MIEQTSTDLADRIRELRLRVDKWPRAARPKLIDQMMEATMAAQRAGRPMIAGQIANARRALERNDVGRAGEALLDCLRMLLHVEREAA